MQRRNFLKSVATAVLGLLGVGTAKVSASRDNSVGGLFRYGHDEPNCKGWRDDLWRFAWINRRPIIGEDGRTRHETGAVLFVRNGQDVSEAASLFSETYLQMQLGFNRCNYAIRYGLCDGSVTWEISDVEVA